MTDDRGKPYARMSVAEKQAMSRDRLREPSVTCPTCQTQTTASDLLRHVDETCLGQRAPHPASRWVTWREVRALGVPKGTLARWVQQGQVRFQGAIGTRWDPGRRRYLLRDLALRIATRRARTKGPHR